VHKIKRKFFNEKTGLDLLDRYCLRDDLAACRLDDDKYLCLTAAGCLLRYISYDQKLFTFAPGSLRASYANTRGSMQVDINTVQSLELVRNTRSFTTAQAQGAAGTKAAKRSLFDILNHTLTKSGARLLRMSLLQPLTDENTIRVR
jgi:DNA mismatch repair protein MSH4